MANTLVVIWFIPQINLKIILDFEFVERSEYVLIGFR